MELKELTISELSQGFVRSEEKGTLTCIFCGETLYQGNVYKYEERLLTAERCMAEHIYDVHGGVFGGLIELDKQVSGLSDIQKQILAGMYQEKDNKELSEEMDISAATVRTHKFNIQKMKREARILLAILNQIEDEDTVFLRKQMEAQKTGAEQGTASAEGNSPDSYLTANSLHPFFTQFNLK